MDLTGSWKYIEEVARSRLAHNRTPRHIPGYGDELEILGAAGELAARRFLGFDDRLHTHFDGGVDMAINGKTLDVKATHITPKIRYRYLQWPVSKKVVSDYIVLTGVDMQTRQAVVIGYATRIEIQNAPVNTQRLSPCHEIPVWKLHPAWELLVRKIHRNPDL
jgi:hypothetical protein